MKIAVSQLRVEESSQHLDDVLESVAQAADEVDVICFPEYFLGKLPPEPMPNSALLAIQEVARLASINVVGGITRDLRPGDSIVVFLDGQRVEESAGLSTTLTDLTRGTHFLRAAVTDEGGSAVITSPQVTFHLRQATIATPPSGPAVPPRPRPPTTPPRPTPQPRR